MSSFSDSESLMESGVIDSLGIFRLVAFLEETFRVRIGDEEITHDNLKSVDSIEQMVEENQEVNFSRFRARPHAPSTP